MSILNGQPLNSPLSMPVGPAGPGFGPGRGVGKVGMWGAPGSGKTTFLAALSIASLNSASESLMFYGVDKASNEFLTQETARLTHRRQFPPATNAERHLSWIMHMETQVPVRKWGLPSTVTRPFEFSLDMLDAPGRMFADTPEVGAGVGRNSGFSAGGASARLGFEDEDEDATIGDEDRFVDDLAGCRGVLLLFDPIREWKQGDAFNYFHGTLMKLAQRLMPGRSRPGAKLPQYIAVCTTMFDQQDVYRRARERGYSKPSLTDPHLFPRVSDELAERFFVDMVKEAQRGNADLVRNALRHFFERDRVKFFVTSAVGFHLDRRLGMFQEAEFSNVEHAGGEPRIRGPIYPINVIEPLIWLGRSLAKDEGAGYAR